MHGGKRAGAGRKPVTIDLGEMAKVCGLQCTDEEVAAFFNVKVRTIERRRQKEPAFAAAMEHGRAKGRISVRRLLHLQAAQGKLPALIFLAKNLPARSNEPSGPNAGTDGKKPMKLKGSMMELLVLYRKLTLGTPSDEELFPPQRSWIR
jgi:hypothetical protein